MLERLWRKGNPSALLVGLQTGATTVENGMEFPQNLKMELPFDPAIPLLGLYPKNLCTPMFIAAKFTIAKYWKQPKCPSANAVSYTHLTLPTIILPCRSRWSPYH